MPILAKCLISVAFLSAISSCSSPTPKQYAKENRAKKEKPAKEESIAPTDQPNDLSRFAATSCDAALWNHVYDPTRLQIVKQCMTVSGVVEETTADDDGDQHFLLKLDPGQEGLVNKRNNKKKNGDLVVEIVCANPVKIKKAKAACAGYSNHIALPAVGAHVKVTGSYVIDTHNGWAEIHPVSQLQ